MNKERARKIAARENRQESLARGGSREATAKPGDKKRHTIEDVKAASNKDGKDKGRIN